MYNGENIAEYNSLSDEKLVFLLRDGSEKALNLLAGRYMGFVRGLTHTYYADSLTPEDWFQEGMIGFLRAVKTFDPAAQASFATYASVCIRSRLNSVWRASNSSKNAPLNKSVELKDESLPSVNSPEDDYINNEQYRFVTNDFIEQLSATERDVLICYLSGFSYGETAEKLGINEKSVDNALCRARAKLKKAFKN